MRGISWLTERTLSFSRRTLLHGVSKSRTVRWRLESRKLFDAAVGWLWTGLSTCRIRVFSLVINYTDIENEVCSMKMAVFWVLAPYSLVEVYWRFRGACCLHHQEDKSCFIDECGHSKLDLLEWSHSQLFSYGCCCFKFLHVNHCIRLCCCWIQAN
jgi:hypothetical protein